MKRLLYISILFAAAVIVAVVFCPSAPAATLVWDGEGGDGMWGTATNWDTNSLPQTGDSLTFYSMGTSSLNNNLSASNVYETILIWDGNVTLDGNEIKVNEGLESWGNLTMNTSLSGQTGQLRLGEGSTTLNVTSTYGGGTFVGYIGNPTTLTVTAPNLLPVGGNINVGQSSVLDIQGDQTVGALVTQNNSSINGSAYRITGTSYEIGGGTVNAILSGSANLVVTPGGGVAFNGTQEYTGTTTINQGMVNVYGSLASPQVTVNGLGAFLTSNGTLQSVTVQGGGAIKAEDPTTGFGDTMHVAQDLTLGEGGRIPLFVWDTAGQPGTDWGLVNIDGAMNVTATAQNQAVINLSGQFQNFDKTQTKTWTVASAAGGINDFSGDKFYVNASGLGFPMPVQVAGEFSVVQSGNDLQLKYEPKPLPIDILHSFDYNAEGVSPVGEITFDGNFIYGTTSMNNPTNTGTVYRVGTDGQNMTVLATFDYNATGRYAYGGVTLSADKTQLYIPTSEVGPLNHGAIVSVAAGGGAPSVLYDFSNLPNDGTGTYGHLARVGDYLYGTTNGGWPGQGTIFKINAADSMDFTVLHTFDYNQGLSSFNGLTFTPDGSAAFGTLMMNGGGTDFGSIYRIGMDGSYSTVYTFGATGLDTEVTTPARGELILLNNTLYGMAYNQQFGNGGWGGLIYKVNTDGTNFVSLYQIPFEYAGYTGQNMQPLGDLVIADGKLYGLTGGGGMFGSGTFFSLNLDGTGFTVIHSFRGSTDDGALIGGGAFPGSNQGTLALSPDGTKIYGVTSAGGENNQGVLFSYTVGSPQLVERPVMLSIDQETGALAYVNDATGNVTFFDGADEQVIGPGAHPSSYQSMVVYRAPDGYRLWAPAGSGWNLNNDLMNVTLPTGYDGGATAGDFGVAVEGADGIYFNPLSNGEFSAANTAQVVAGTEYRHPIMAGNWIVLEYYGADNLSHIQLYDYNGSVWSYLSEVTAVDIDYNNQTKGAVPWIGFDWLSQTYYLAWQAWDGTDWEIFYRSYDVGSATWGAITQVTNNDNSGGKYIDDMYPEVGNDGTVVWMSYDDWDIYQWTESGGTQLVAGGAGDQMYPAVGGEIWWGNFDQNGDLTGYSNNFGQQIDTGGQVPEPSTLLLLLPLLGFGLRKIKRSARL